MNMNKTIAIVDDEEDIVELVSVNLKKNGYASRGFSEAKSFFRFLKNNRPDVIILDLMLPDMDGYEICKELKKDARTAAIPVIMLSARSDETDKILGLELGADDYVTKPFSPKELVARVKVALRKSAAAAAPAGGNAPIVLNEEKFEVSAMGKKVELTTTEFKILQLLMTRRGYVFARDRILDHLWGDEKIVVDRTIDVHIKHLREKLGAAGELIKNVRGVGYKLEE